MEETPYLQGRESWIEKLKKITFFSGLSDDYTREILNLTKIRKYDSGERIIAEGSFDCWMYIIVSGAVKVIKNGKEIARLSRVGELLGELSLIDGAARSASVYAEEKTYCLAIDGSFLDRIGPEERCGFGGIFYRLFAEVLAERLRITSNELSRLRQELEQYKARETRTSKQET